MIRTLVAVDGGLVRGALSFVLSAHPDIDVVGEVGSAEEVLPLVDSHRPDVSVVDLDLIRPDDLPRACAGYEASGRGRVLVLVALRRAIQLGGRMTRHAPQVGFLSKDAPPERVVDGVVRLARGETVVDPDLIEAALTGTNPLTLRENEILEIAAAGRSVREIAGKLSLSPGTVRNHLSRILAKTGARTRVDAVRIARESGWI